MNKNLKITLFAAGALALGVLSYVGYIQTTVELPLSVKQNSEFTTLPVKLGESLPLSAVGRSLNYADLTEHGQLRYKEDLRSIEDGQWVYLNDSQNMLVALNGDRDIAMVKVHYSFKNSETLDKYLDKIKGTYPQVTKIEDGSKDTSKLIISEHTPQIDYTDMNSYLTSILKELKAEKASDRMNFERSKLFIEVDHINNTSIETYIDFKLAPRWSQDYVEQKRKETDLLITQLESEFNNHPAILLNSNTYMKYLVKNNEIHIFK